MPAKGYLESSLPYSDTFPNLAKITINSFLSVPFRIFAGVYSASFCRCFEIMADYILGIESSCDDTSAAVLKDGLLMSNVIASQQVHKDFGGVVPELA